MDFASLEPLSGGWSGQTFVGEAGGERTVVRIYSSASHRGDAAHEVDAALLRLVRGILPVPEVLEVRRADPASGTPAILVTSYLPGRRGDELLGSLDDAGLARLGANVGRLLADLGGMPMLREGAFVEGDLTIGDLPGPDGLPEWVESSDLRDVTDDELAGLSEVAGRAQDLLDTVGRRCLVHSDVNPKNLLVDPDSLAITGLVDWEYAHAGHPATDLGNVLRFDRQPAYADAVLAAYTDRRGGDPAHHRDLARAADLWALVDLAVRHASAPENAVAARAHGLLRAIGRTRDLHAEPPEPAPMQ